MTTDDYSFKADRRAAKKENRRFPIHGLSLQHVVNATRKRALVASTKHSFSGCWCGHEKGHRWNGAILKCDRCIDKEKRDRAMLQGKGS